MPWHCVSSRYITVSRLHDRVCKTGRVWSSICRWTGEFCRRCGCLWAGVEAKWLWWYTHGMPTLLAGIWVVQNTLNPSPHGHASASGNSVSQAGRKKKRCEAFGLAAPRRRVASGWTYLLHLTRVSPTQLQLQTTLRHDGIAHVHVIMDPNVAEAGGESRGSGNANNPFVCNVCQKTYGRIDHLARHFRSRKCSIFSDRMRVSLTVRIRYQ